MSRDPEDRTQRFGTVDCRGIAFKNVGEDRVGAMGVPHEHSMLSIVKIFL
jgi:hypothetical protein